MIKLQNYEKKTCTLGNSDFLQIVEVQQERNGQLIILNMTIKG